MGYGHANCQKCGEPTNVFPEVGEDESGILCKDCRIAELEGKLAELEATLDEPLPDFPHMVGDPPARCEGCYVIVKALEHAK